MNIYVTIESVTSKMANWYIVAVAGVSCGGKTTLTKRLADKLPFPVVTFFQDDYFLPESSDKHVMIEELNHANWDIVSSVEFDKIMDNIRNCQAAVPDSVPGIILLDGNLILNYRPIEQICNKKFYIVLNKEECWTRRQTREYQPPDPPGYFDRCVWPMYEMYKNEIDKKVQDIVYVDGSEDMDQIYSKVYDIILHSVQQYVNNT